MWQRNKHFSVNPNSFCSFVSLSVITSSIRFGFYGNSSFPAIVYCVWLVRSSVSATIICYMSPISFPSLSFMKLSCVSSHSEITTMIFLLLYLLYCWCALHSLRQWPVTKVSFYFTLFFFEFCPVLTDICLLWPHSFSSFVLCILSAQGSISSITLFVSLIFILMLAFVQFVMW